MTTLHEEKGLSSDLNKSQPGDSVTRTQWSVGLSAVTYSRPILIKRVTDLYLFLDDDTCWVKRTGFQRGTIRKGYYAPSRAHTILLITNADLFTRFLQDHASEISSRQRHLNAERKLAELVSSITGRRIHPSTEAMEKAIELLKPDPDTVPPI